MANNNTNIVSVVFHALPAPPPPTSTTESSPSPSWKTATASCATEDTDSRLCLPMDATEAGTASNCNFFTSVDLSYSDVYTCDDISYDYSLTMDDLVSWLVGDCDTALYTNLNATDDRAICIGVGSAAATTTARGTATQTPTTTSSMGPTPTGTVSGREKFYTTTKGDDYATVETKFRITLAQFYQTLSTSTTMPRRSKRDPTMYSFMNEADLVEKLLKEDGFTIWGFVIFRCTYHNDSDWKNFMARMVGAVSEDLKEYSGLDLLDTFAPTVLEDPSFEGATVATLREHFHQWKKSALKEEQGVSEDYTPTSGRYRFFITVDQEAMESVLNTPLGVFEEYELGHVRMVNAKWKWTYVPEEDSEDEDISEPEFEPLEGCTEDDVGWMNIRWRIVQLRGFHKITEIDDWETYYVRYPGIANIN
ncbi:hypothetical protein N7445_007121 [Penicillium cf. griseofulvum]|nr:hypothetical protein N7445_007121 [Penicillium cf. griseofulvum]